MRGIFIDVDKNKTIKQDKSYTVIDNHIGIHLPSELKRKAIKKVLMIESITQHEYIPITKDYIIVPDKFNVCSEVTITLIIQSAEGTIRTNRIVVEV